VPAGGREGRLGVVHGRRAHGGLEGGALRLVPHARECVRGPVARTGLGAAVRRAREAGGGDRQAGEPGDGPASAGAPGVARERGEQRLHAGPAVVGGEREPALEDRPQPGRDLGPLGRRDELAGEHVGPQLADIGALERTAAVEPLPHRRAEPELIAAGVGLVAAELLG
jgi:hypothetical protein